MPWRGRGSRAESRDRGESPGSGIPRACDLQAALASRAASARSSRCAGCLPPARRVSKRDARLWIAAPRAPSSWSKLRRRARRPPRGRARSAGRAPPRLALPARPPYSTPGRSRARTPARCREARAARRRRRAGRAAPGPADPAGARRSGRPRSSGTRRSRRLICHRLGPLSGTAPARFPSPRLPARRSGHSSRAPAPRSRRPARPRQERPARRC